MFFHFSFLHFGSISMSKNVNFRYRSEVPKSIDLGSILGVPKGVHFGTPKGTKFIAFPLDQCQKWKIIVESFQAFWRGWLHRKGRVFPSDTRVHLSTLEYTGVRWSTPEYTGVHWSTLEYTRVHWSTLEYTRVH